MTENEHKAQSTCLIAMTIDRMPFTARLDAHMRELLLTNEVFPDQESNGSPPQRRWK
jgi:hypothetical protein